MIPLMKTLSFLALTFALSGSLFAQSQSEMNAEAARDAAKADKELNQVYKKVLATLDDEGAKLLKVSQRAWIAYRDAEAASAADEARGGSMAPMLYSGTVGRLTEQRTQLLKERLGEESAAPPPEKPAPRAEPVIDPPQPPPVVEANAPAGAKTQSLASQQFFDAYKAHDQKAAHAIAAEAAIKKLVWKTSAGDNPTLKLMDNTHIYYEGGSIELKLAKNAAGRWFVADVVLYAD